MAIVIRNDKPQGRFIRYRVNGVPKSVWIDAYSELLIEEVSDTSKILNKVERAKIQKEQDLSNQSTISSFLFKSNIRGFRDISDSLKWKPILVELKTGLKAYIFIKNGVRFIFTIDPRQSLEVGTEVFDENGNRITSVFNGVYELNNISYGVRNGTINSITDGQDGGDKETRYISWSVIDSKANNLTIYTTDDQTILERGTIVFLNDDGTGQVADDSYTYNDRGSIVIIEILRNTVSNVTVSERGR